MLSKELESKMQFVQQFLRRKNLFRKRKVEFVRTRMAVAEKKNVVILANYHRST